MNPIHTSYKTSKMLKEFLGESAPQPLTYEWWSDAFNQKEIIRIKFTKGHENAWNVPAYQLHDLLSKPFCEAMAYKWAMLNPDGFVRTGHGTAKRLMSAYYTSGLPAVEKALTEMMEGK